MEFAVLTSHGNHATVAAAKTAAHHALHRYLARASVFHRGPRGRGQHSLRAACVQHHGRGRRARREASIEWRDHAPGLSQAAVLCREHQLDVPLTEKVEVEEL